MPFSGGRASPRAACQMTSVWSVGWSRVRWRDVTNAESRTLTDTFAPSRGRAAGARDALRERQQGALDHLPVVGVDIERVLVADRLRGVAAADDRRIDAASSLRQDRTLLAEAAHEQVIGQARQVADGRTP